MESIFQIANGAAEGIIWLIIIIFWGIAQLVNAIMNSQRKSDPGKPRPTRRNTERKRPEPPASLPDFLEEILAGKQTQAPPPPPARKPRPEPAQPAPPAPTPAFSAKEEELREVKRRRDAEQADAFGERPSERVAGMRSFKLPSLKLPTTGNPLSHNKVKREPRIAFNLRNNDNFKRAVLTRIVIGPPKALADDRFFDRD